MGAGACWNGAPPDRIAELHEDPFAEAGLRDLLPFCVGMHIARLDAECLLAAFIRRVRRCAVVGEPACKVNNTVRGQERLCLRVTRA